MKRYKVTPVETIELEFEDGHIIAMRFSMKAMAYLGEMLKTRKIAMVGPEFYSALIYAGCKAVDEDFTIDEADALYVTLNDSQPEALNGIFSAYCESVGIDEDEIKKKAMKAILQ